MTEHIRAVPSLSVLCRQQISVNRAKAMDFNFLKQVQTDLNNTPEHNGYNTKMSREQGHTVRFATTPSFRPLIIMPPDDYDTLFTTMYESQTRTQSLGQEWTVFTVDQQLYRKVIDITIVYPELFSKFIPQLGGIHLQMSFVGGIGKLM